MDTQQTPTTLAEIRLAILRQHTQLAQLLDELELHARAVLDASTCSLDDVDPMHQALDTLSTRLLRHLDYEDTHLTRWLSEAAGRQSAGLLGDHGEQRSRVRGLVHDRAVFADARTLAREAIAFVHALRKDMAAEESALRALR